MSPNTIGRNLPPIRPEALRLRKGNTSMPLPGGPSDKAGNRYEYLWTVMCMVRLMKGEAHSIYLEPPGHEGEGIEFSITTSSGTEYHQTKRQLTGRGVWSLYQLASRRVLSDFHQRLRNPSASCVFASSHAAHPLDELASRARKADSLADFEQRFLSDDWSVKFDELHRRWSSSDEEGSKEDSYHCLRRVRVVTEDEASLRRSVEYALETLISGDPANALSVLLDFVSNLVHQTVTPTDVWDFLQSRGFSKQHWAQEQAITDVILELTRAYESGIKPVGIGQEVVPRVEVDRILDTFDDAQAENMVLVSGKAGVGKTSTISQLLARVESRGWPLLALRVDRLQPSDTPTELGRSLGLPASPVSVLAAVAEGQECLLIMDQMDAISQASGRKPEFFDCIAAMFEQAQSHPNMKVLSACRKFDIDNDPRIRELTAEGGVAREIQVEQFDETTVRSVVERLGLDADTLSAKQINLLSLPIHLRLLAETLSGNGVDSLGFQTSTDLYNRFWDYKRMGIRSHMDNAQIQRIVSLMINSMMEREVLFVPLATLDEYHDAVSVMVSENILIRDGESVSFFHEGFFDYICARSFVSANLDLVSYILEHDQSLFIRSQIRQVLLYQRDASRQEYSRNVENILTNKEIRPHLKTIVLSLFSSLDNPTEKEWRIVQLLLESYLSGHVWNAIHGSVGWFDLLDRIGVVQRWLQSSDEQLVNRTMWVLSPFQKERADRIAELLSPFVGGSDLWDVRLANFFARSDASASKSFLELVLSLVNAGVLDNLVAPGKDSEHFWYPIRPVADSTPDGACRLIASYFTRLVTLASQTGKSNPFPSRFNSHRTAQDVISKAAEGAPKPFVEMLLPILIAVTEANADKSYGPPWRDQIWGYGPTNLSYGLENVLLVAMETAMCWVALNDPDEFRIYAAKFRESEYHTIQHMLVRALAANGKCFADEAVEYLLADTEKRFAIDQVSTSSDHPIQQLLRAITPYCSSNSLNCLQDSILDYYPIWERGPHDRTIRGAFQLGLLEHIDGCRLSERAFRRLQELQRKFGDRRPADPIRTEGGWVGPPIAEPSARRMSDDDWLRAITRYSSNSPSRAPGKLLVGGALQMSRVLEDLTRENPERVARLVHRIPDEANTTYFEAILRGLEGADVDPQLVVAACLRCHSITDRPLGRWITQPLAHIGQSSLPDEALDIVAWYATEDSDPDPLQTSPNRTSYQGGKEVVAYDPVFVGINSVRGAAARSIARLIFQDERFLCYFKPYLKTMVNDPSDGTRACVVEALLGTLRYDPDLAVELFVELADLNEGLTWLGVLPRGIRKWVGRIACFVRRPTVPSKWGRDERLLAIDHVERFFKYATQTHFLQLERILVRMTESPFETVATVGARWICFAALTLEEAVPLARHCVSGSKWLRLGAADVYSANLRTSTHRSVCEESLSKLFSDSQPEVRRAAARCFYDFEQHELEEFRSLVEEYIQSPAFESENNPLFDALEKTTAEIHDVILMACERVFDLAGKQIGDADALDPGMSGSIANLVVRVYSRTNDPSLRSRCLDVIDKMSVTGTYGIDTIMEEFDR